MPEDKEARDNCPEESDEEELFGEPLGDQVQRSWTSVNAALRSVEQTGASPKLTLAMPRVVEALDGIMSFGTLISEASSRLASLVEPVCLAVRTAEQIESALATSAHVDLSPLWDHWRTIGSALDRYQGVYQAIVSIQLASFLEGLPKITFDFDAFLDGLDRAHAQLLARTLRRYHWWPVPGLPDELYSGILDVVEQGRLRRVNRYICDWFGWNRYRRLGRVVVRRWDDNKYFCSRRHIYRQALVAHRRGWYNLTVPALIPLVEGIARDYLESEYGITERSGRRAIERALGQNVPPSVFREELQQALIRFLTTSTFADTECGDVLPSGYELNRHGVAHGRHLQYGTEANSLRCFLLLETLYQFITPSPSEISWS